MSEHVSLMANKFPSKLALLHPVRITFGELQDEIDRYAHGLSRAGIKNGKRTLLLIPPGPEFFILTFALLRVGAVPMMIDPGMGLKTMGKALATVDAEAFIGSSKAHLLRYILPEAFKTVRTFVTLGRKWSRRGYCLSDLRSDQTAPCPPAHNHPHRTAAIFFTSGSTGIPKGVVYTHAMLNAQISLLESEFKYHPDEIELCTFPLLGLFSICIGQSIVLADMDMSHPASLDPKKISANILKNQCSQMFCSPMVLNRMARHCNANRIQFPSLKKVITAGAPVSMELMNAFKQCMPSEAEIHAPYGATEALPLTNLTLSDLDGIDIAGSEGSCLGIPLKGIEIKIIEITDEPIALWQNASRLGTDDVGEIVVKGPVVSPEYFHLLLASSAAKMMDQDDGGFWHRMGDLGRIDASGRLWYYGRKSQRLITSEGTLYTIPCEAVFNSHPRVFRTALVGIADKSDQTVKPVLCVQLEAGNKRSDRAGLIQELLEMGAANPMTRTIRTLRFPRTFPVDARHNAKINREKLALWAAQRKL